MSEEQNRQQQQQQTRHRRRHSTASDDEPIRRGGDSGDDEDAKNNKKYDMEKEVYRHVAKVIVERAIARLEDEVLPHTHLIAVDGSADSHRAFIWACNSLPRQDRLLVVNGVQLHETSPELDWMESTEWSKNAQNTSHRLLGGYDGLCQAAGRQCTFETVEYRNNSDLSRKLCQLAEEREAATVICGSRGSHNLDRMVLGSVSTGLVQRCRCSVLVARNIRGSARSSYDSTSPSSSREQASSARNQQQQEFVRGEVPIVL